MIPVRDEVMEEVAQTMKKILASLGNTTPLLATVALVESLDCVLQTATEMIGLPEPQEMLAFRAALGDLMRYLGPALLYSREVGHRREQHKVN
jgi:hypothetical protein